MHGQAKIGGKPAKLLKTSLVSIKMLWNKTGKPKKLPITEKKAGIEADQAYTTDSPSKR